MGRLLISSVGGPASENVIRSLEMSEFSDYPIIGVDCDPYFIQISSANKKFLVHNAHEEERYLMDLRNLWKKFNITMLYPQSDLEVYVCSKNRDVLPPMSLPNHKTIELCQDKGNLYYILKSHGIEVPDFTLYDNDFKKFQFPCWARARHGAGGNKGFKALYHDDFLRMVGYWYDREPESIKDWMLIEFLEGRDYSWTSIWRDGKLLTSVLKERLKWVYNRIGTTAVQRTIYDYEVNSYCKRIIKTLEPEITGIMMIDLKEDTDQNKFYLTEINAGRLGTVNMNYAMASRKFYKDDRVNFPYILWCIHHDLSLPKSMREFNALPEGLYYIRHLDMKRKLVFM